MFSDIKVHPFDAEFLGYNGGLRSEIERGPVRLQGASLQHGRGRRGDSTGLIFGQRRHDVRVSVYSLSIHVSITNFGWLSVLIGEIDDALDHATDLASVRAEPIPPIRY